MEGNMFWIMAVGIMAAMGGFWTGRLSLLGAALASESEEAPIGEASAGKTERSVESMRNRGIGTTVERARNRGTGAFVEGAQDRENGVTMERAWDREIGTTVEQARNRGIEAPVERTQNRENGTTVERARDRESGIPVERIRSRENRLSAERTQNRGIGTTAERAHTRQEKPDAHHRKWRPARKQRGGEKRIPAGWAIGSPAAGWVSIFSEGVRQGAVVQASQGMMYAPASGKITKLYPMGNQMILRTDFGVELLLRVGGSVDELQGEYFRPRILQNEIVNKGKLLLEYDRNGILMEGGNADISVSVAEAEDSHSVTVTDREQVGVGEEILWVRKRSCV